MSPGSPLPGHPHRRWGGESCFPCRWSGAPSPSRLTSRWSSALPQKRRAGGARAGTRGTCILFDYYLWMNAVNRSQEDLKAKPCKWINLLLDKMQPVCSLLQAGTFFLSYAKDWLSLLSLLYCYRGGNLSKTMYSELLNSTGATEAHLIMQTNTPYLSTPRPVSSSAFYMSTARVLKEGEINKPDLVTYIIMFFFLLLTVTLIVLFINCQLKNSFFATLPYDRSLREARSPWRTQAVWH